MYMANLENLLLQRKRTVYWHVLDNVCFPSYSPMGRTNMDIKYTKQDFEAIDPRLVQIIEQNQPTFSHILLADALDYWSRPVMLLPKRDGATGKVIGTHTVKEFTSFSWTSPTSEVVVKFQCYDMCKTETDVFYPVSTKPYQVEVPRYWMDENYPHWEKRYDIAKSLELDSKEMTLYLTGNTNIDSDLSLADIQFNSHNP